eukprot:g1573.t1
MWVHVNGDTLTIKTVNKKKTDLETTIMGSSVERLSYDLRTKHKRPHSLVITIPAGTPQGQHGKKSKKDQRIVLATDDVDDVREWLEILQACVMRIGDSDGNDGEDVSSDTSLPSKAGDAMLHWRGRTLSRWAEGAAAIYDENAQPVIGDVSLPVVKHEPVEAAASELLLSAPLLERLMQRSAAQTVPPLRSAIGRRISCDGIAGVAEDCYGTMGVHAARVAGEASKQVVSQSSAEHDQPKAHVGYGLGLSVRLSAIEAADNAAVASTRLADDEWNLRFQQLRERPEGANGELEGSVEKALALRALCGRFCAVAEAVARAIVQEYALPNALKLVKPLDADASGGGRVFLHRGMLLFAAQRPTPDDVGDSLEGDSGHAARRLVGHELRAAEAWQAAFAQLSAAATANQSTVIHAEPHLCTAAACAVDFGGWRFLAMAVPPVDDNDDGEFCTLIAGRVGSANSGALAGALEGTSPSLAGPAVANSAYRKPPRVLRDALLRAGAELNLKPHQLLARVAPSPRRVAGAPVPPEAGREVASHVLVCSVDTQCHLCHDSRYYMLNLARSLPPDLPLPRPFPCQEELPYDYVGDSSSVVTQVRSQGRDLPVHGLDMLRAEAVKRFSTALSVDAYRNDLAPTTRGVAAHPGVPQPSPVPLAPPDAQQNDVMAAQASQWLTQKLLPSFVSRLDSLELLPLDSAALTQLMHAEGINARRLGDVARLTALPHMRAMAIVEMVARTTKLELARRLRRISALAAQQCSRLHGQRDDGTVHHYRDTLERCDEQATAEVVRLFNQVLRRSSDSNEVWRCQLAPRILRKFGHALTEADLRTMHTPQLLHALQHHCAVQLVPTAITTPTASAAATHSGSLSSPTTVSLDAAPLDADAVLRSHARVKCPNDIGLDAMRLSAKAEEFLQQGEFALALQALKLRLSLLQAHDTGAHEAMADAAVTVNDALAYATGCLPELQMEQGRALVDMASTATRAADLIVCGQTGGSVNECSALVDLALTCGARAVRLLPPLHALTGLAHAAISRARLVLIHFNAAQHQQASGVMVAKVVDADAVVARDEALKALKALNAHLGPFHPALCEAHALLADAHHRQARVLMRADLGDSGVAHRHSLHAVREMAAARKLARTVLGGSAPPTAWYTHCLATLQRLSAICAQGAGAHHAAHNSALNNFSTTFFGGAAQPIPIASLALQRAHTEAHAALLVLSPALRAHADGARARSCSQYCAVLLQEQDALRHNNGGNAALPESARAIAECCLDMAQILADRGLLQDALTFAQCAAKVLERALVAKKGTAQRVVSLFVQANWRAAQVAEGLMELDDAVKVRMRANQR